MKRNTMTLAEYIGNHLYWLSILFILYNNTLFRCIFGTRHAVSVAILVGFILLGATLGVLFTFRTRRNNLSLICNLTLAYAPYFLITFWAPARKPLTTAAQLTATVLVCWLLFLIISYAYRRKTGGTRASVRRLIAACLRAAARIPLLALTAVMTFTILRATLHFPMLTPSQPAAPTTIAATREELIFEHAEALLQLEEAQWQTLSPIQRLDVLAIVGSIEAKVLGIPEVDIGSSVMNDSLWAQYTREVETIAINLTDLSTMSATQAVHSLCHEYHHAYQHNLVMLYDTLDPEQQSLALFQDAKQYKYEFDHYIDATYGDNYDEYSTQLCETHSELYAQAALEEYVDCLSYYAGQRIYTSSHAE